MKPDQERVHSLLVDTLTLLCKNGLNFQKGLKVEGVIGITVDEKDVFIVHINEVLRSDAVERHSTIQDDDASQKADFMGSGLTETTFRRKRKRSRSGNQQTDKTADDMSQEIPVIGTGLPNSTTDENEAYVQQVGFDTREYEDKLLKQETNENTGIFVKTEESEIADSYEEDSPTLAIAPGYSGARVSESLVSCESQFLRSNAQSRNEKQVTISPYQHLPTYERVDLVSNFATDAAFKYKQDEADHNFAEVCDPNLDNNQFHPPLEAQYAETGGRQFSTSRKYSWYPRIPSSGFRKKTVGTGYTLQRKTEGENWQVMSRFLCNFPDCSLSFSTKQNLLRHQTQKHGRQKSRIVSNTHRYSSNPIDSLCDSI